jgi:DNA-binding beta-propeller fold protein YncE
MNSSKRPRALLALLLAGLFLIGCSSGGGGDGGAPANVPRFAFVASVGNNSVSSYVVDAATGRLKYIGKVAAGWTPSSVSVDPSGNYAYVANNGSNNVSQYTIGADGALTPMSTAAVAAGTESGSVVSTGTWQ